MRYEVILAQLDESPNNLFGGLRLKNGTNVFEEMPFASDLLGNVVKHSFVNQSINPKGREHELLVRNIRHITEKEGQIYVKAEQLASFGNESEIDELVRIFNSKLLPFHSGRMIKKKFKKFYYISEYEENTVFIISKLLELSNCQDELVSNYIYEWMELYPNHVDCEEKETILKNIFKKTRVSAIHGSAGTGKTTMISHITDIFKDYNILYLTTTNAAKDNIKRRVNLSASNSTISTIAMFLSRFHRKKEFDILIIDESSTVSNKEMKSILSETKFKYLIVVGDTNQIESINFGNWFQLTKDFLPEKSIHELKTPYRAREQTELKKLWNIVRNEHHKTLEFLIAGKYNSDLDETILEKYHEDEITLCLNYDGIYGINNLNKIMQISNLNHEFEWDHQIYKVGDLKWSQCQGLLSGSN